MGCFVAGFWVFLVFHDLHKKFWKLAVNYEKNQTAKLLSVSIPLERSTNNYRKVKFGDICIRYMLDFLKKGFVHCLLLSFHHFYLLPPSCTSLCLCRLPCLYVEPFLISFSLNFSVISVSPVYLFWRCCVNAGTCASTYSFKQYLYSHTCVCWWGFFKWKNTWRNLISKQKMW